MASKVSRIENGQQLPPDSDVRQWLEAVGASEAIAAEVREWLLEIRLDEDSWRRQLRRGHTPRQEYSWEIERKARSITYVELFLIPGLLQTPDYARAVLVAGQELHGTPRDTEEAIRTRMRRQEVLYDPDKEISILVSEAALRNPICSPRVMISVLDRMQGVLGIANVRLGIIPLGVQLAAVPMHGYVIVDDLVLVEIVHTELSVTDGPDLSLYRNLTELLWRSAAEGDDARKILVRVSQDFASL